MMTITTSSSSSVKPAACRHPLRREAPRRSVARNHGMGEGAPASGIDVPMAGAGHTARMSNEDTIDQVLVRSTDATLLIPIRSAESLVGYRSMPVVLRSIHRNTILIWRPPHPG
jgi:hypothetical protein